MGFPTIRLLHDPLNQDLPVSLGRMETGRRSECSKFVHQHGCMKRSSGFLMNQIVDAKASKELKKQSIITCSPLTSAGMSRLVTFRMVFQARSYHGLLLSKLVAVPAAPTSFFNHRSQHLIFWTFGWSLDTLFSRSNPDRPLKIKVLYVSLNQHKFLVEDCF